MSWPSDRRTWAKRTDLPVGSTMFYGSPVNVMLALVFVYQRDGRATTRSVADHVGCQVSTAFRHLKTLRDDGLVAWDDTLAGTLRPLVEPTQVLVS